MKQIERLERLEKKAAVLAGATDFPKEIRVHLCKPTQPGGPGYVEAGIITIPVRGAV